MNKKWIASLASVCLLASSCFTAAMAEGMKPGTYTEVNAFDVPYSPLVSSAQELDGGRVLIDSGLQGLFGVYDESTGELLAQYRMKLNTSYIYRVYHYDFKGFYFA